MSCEAVKVPAFGYLSSWVVLKAVEDTRLLRAWFRLVSAGFQHLLFCRMGSFVREAVFSEVSGFTIIKVIHKIQSVSNSSENT